MTFNRNYSTAYGPDLPPTGDRIPVGRPRRSTGAILLASILFAGILTLWVPSRWALTLFQLALFALLTAGIFRRSSTLFHVFHPITLLLACCSVWGIFQSSLGQSVYEQRTLQAAVDWVTCLVVFLIAAEPSRTPHQREAFLDLTLIFGTLVALASIFTVLTSPAGRVFWLFDVSTQPTLGPFVYKNQYAAFIEAILPLAIVRAIRDRRHWISWTLVAATLLGSVIASGSRAGSVLCLAEVLLIPAIAYVRRQIDGGTLARLTAASAGAIAILTAVVGWQTLWSRFQETNPYSLRWKLVQSSIEMIRDRPWMGFGLGTWSASYPGYALFDNGTFVNQAHNDWLQWGAEGGLLFLIFLLAIAALTIRPAIESLWGIGLLAVFLHGLVDYPMQQRPALTAFFFALLGMLIAATRKGQPSPRVVATIASMRKSSFLGEATSYLALFLVAACWYSVALARADAEFQTGTPESVRHASEIVSGNTEYLSRQALQLDYDGQDPQPLLVQIAALTPLASAPRLRLGAASEIRGDQKAAERWLFEAAEVDHQYEPRWALANYYFRRGNHTEFWKWIRLALEVSYGDRTPAFDLCWNTSTDPEEILSQAIPSDPEVAVSYLYYLLSHQHLEAAVPVAEKLAQAVGPNNRPVLLATCDALLAAGNAADALALWKALGNPVTSLITNPDFETPPQNHGFDWRLPEIPGVKQISNRVDLNGRQPESASLLEQTVLLEPEAHYVLRLETKTRGLANPTGLAWSIAGSHAPIEATPDWHSLEVPFTASSKLAPLDLFYARPTGQPRAQGSIEFRHVSILRQ